MKKSNCTRRYQVWSDEEYQALADDDARWTIQKIIDHHQRNVGGISAALVRIGKVRSRKECRVLWEACL